MCIDNLNSIALTLLGNPVGGEQRPSGIKKLQLHEDLYSFDYQPPDENSQRETIFVASFGEAQQYAELRWLGNRPFMNNIYHHPQEDPLGFPYLDKELKKTSTTQTW